MGVSKSYTLKLKSQLRISKTQASLLPKLKPIVRLNFNPKRNFRKETPIKLFKVADELFHLNSTINHLVILPIIYHGVSIVLTPLYITFLLYVSHSTYILLLHISPFLKDT